MHDIYRSSLLFILPIFVFLGSPSSEQPGELQNVPPPGAARSLRLVRAHPRVFGGTRDGWNVVPSRKDLTTRRRVSVSSEISKVNFLSS
jgi:hypothetical protein